MRWCLIKDHAAQTWLLTHLTMLHIGHAMRRNAKVIHVYKTNPQNEKYKLCNAAALWSANKYHGVTWDRFWAQILSRRKFCGHQVVTLLKPGEHIQLSHLSHHLWQVRQNFYTFTDVSEKSRMSGDVDTLRHIIIVAFSCHFCDNMRLDWVKIKRNVCRLDSGM